MRNSLKSKRVEFFAHNVGEPFSLDEDGALARYIIPYLEVPELLSLGAVILIRDNRKNIDGQYKEFWYSGRVIGVERISSGDILIKVSLSQEWIINRDETNYIASTIQLPPSSNSALFFPKLTSKEREDISPSLQEILDIQQKGLSLGMVGFSNRPAGWAESNLIPYKWNVNAVDNKNLLIAGERGAGKTVLFKKLAYEIRKDSPDKNIVFADSKGDIAQLIFWDSLETIFKNDWEKKQTSVEIKNNLIEARRIAGKLRLIIPTTSNPHLEKNLSVLVNVASDLLHIDIKTVSLRFQDLNSPTDVEHLFQTTSTQVATLLEDLSEGIKVSGDEVSLSRLHSAISRLLTRNSNREIVLPTNGITYNRSVLESSLRVLRSLEPYFDIFYDFNLPEESINPLNYFDFSGTVIVYLNHLSRDERLLWRMQLLNWFSAKKNNANTCLFFDEAHKILPKEKSSDLESDKRVFAKLRTKFEKLAREEKGHSPTLILSTQNPQDLHKVVQEYCSTKVVMRTNIENANHLSLPKDLAYVASNLNYGQFWINSSHNRMNDWVRVHGTAPPVPHESMDKFWAKLKEIEKYSSSA